MSNVLSTTQATTTQHGAGALLSVRKLGVSFRTDEGLVRAVNGIDFDVYRGKTLGIVGESGSGKSVSTLALTRLLPRNARVDANSSIRLTRASGDVVDISALHPNSRAIRQIRGGEIAMIFQEPMASFSPVYTIGNHMVEAIRQHRQLGKKEALQLAIDLLDKVGMSNPAQRVKQYPFELSGGMRQRAMIALALSTNPSLLIADEPTTALDVTIQAQILTLLRSLQDEFGMAMIFITHDLGVISQVADDLAVMYLGEVMEQGAAREVIRQPQHPYTKSLLRAIPKLDTLGRRLTAIGGSIPSPLNRPSGCPFHTRCAEVRQECIGWVPKQFNLNNRKISCLQFESL